jgi:hypothetical protein
MRINEVQAQVRYSSEVRGSWVTIELGSTASLTSSEETLESVSAELYQRLTKQLKALWANNKAGGSETQAEALVSRSPELSEGEAKGQTPNPNWCAEHHTEFKQFSKNGNSWFSHKTADGTWHNRGN